MRALLLSLLLTSCANSPASRLLAQATPIPTPAQVDVTAEEAYYFGMMDTCVLFGLAHFEAELPNAEIEADIQAKCFEFVRDAVAYSAWEERPK